MFLYQQLMTRQSEHRPVKALLIGAGKFGSMFLSQIPTTPALDVRTIVDLNPDKAKNACRIVGWDDDLLSRTGFTDQLPDNLSDIDVVIEATGDPVAGVRHARQVIAAGRHIVMVNVEADVLAGAALAAEARAAGVVYSMAYGDQPSLVCEMVDWARSCGFSVMAAGKGTKYLANYHQSTPDTVWDHFGLSAEEAKAAGMNSKMFNSFTDGTKSALEMAAIANATGLAVPDDGLGFPACGVDDLAHVLRPRSMGGLLEKPGQVEVISSLERDGRPVFRDLRWGVYVVLEAPNDYAAACFRQYGLPTDSTGRFAAMYKPFHLIGLELNISVLAASLCGTATGSTKDFTGDVVAVAKRDLAPGDILDGEGGFSVWGKLIPAPKSLGLKALPIGLAHHRTMIRPVAQGATISWDDVGTIDGDDVADYRRAMELAHQSTN